MAGRTGTGKQKLIGLLGGSFDPVHLGHINLAQELLNLYSLDEIYLIPNKQNPLKPSSPMATNEQRLKMLSLAIGEIGEPRIKMGPWELERQSLSYTIDTLVELKAKNILSNESESILILGNEVFQQFKDWKSPREILERTHLCIVNRDPLLDSVLSEQLRSLGILDGTKIGNRVIHSNGSRWVENVKINALPYSSTKLREKINLALKLGPTAKMPQGIQRSVWLFIKENQLYGR